MKKTTNSTGTRSSYTPVADNVYHDGYSYRVRVSVNGNKISKNFSNKRKAIVFRNQLLKSA